MESILGLFLLRETPGSPRHIHCPSIEVWTLRQSLCGRSRPHLTHYDVLRGCVDEHGPWSTVVVYLKRIQLESFRVVWDLSLQEVFAEDL